MAELDRQLGKLSGVPWRGILTVLAASFLTASLLSTVTASFLMPVDAKSPHRTAAVSNISVPNPTATLTQRSIDLILKRNIFGSEVTDAEDKGADEAAVSPTAHMTAIKSDLPLKLVGTIFSGDPLSGIALIENNNKKSTNSFLVGDAVVKDAVLKEIYKERVILERNGRLEYLEIEKVELSRTRRKPKPSAAKSGDDRVAPIATEPPPPNFREEGFERKERDITMTSAYRSKLLSTDLTKVLQDAKATPYMAEGEIKGWTLTRIRKDSIYEKAGLQNDDVVTELNGVPLSDASQAIRHLQNLRNEPEIEVRILRGGSPMNFTLQVR